MEKKIKDMMDAQSMRALRMCIVTRHDVIQRVYGVKDTNPLYLEVKQEKLKQLEDLIHLCNEVGLDYEEVVGEDRNEEPVRYYTDREGLKENDIVSVFGWYGEQEWVEVRLVKKTGLGWRVARRDRSTV